MVDKYLTGAHYGIKDWVIQRITAIIMLLYTLLLIIGLFSLPKDYLSWQRFFSYFIVKLFTQITCIALSLHAWVGVRDIWMDYIKPTSIRLILHTLTIIWLIGIVIYSIKIIWGA